MAYSDKVIDHYNHPRNVGVFPRKTRRWAQAWWARRSAATS
jgi:NifU-like protein involved in Fe-S cluster formation